LKKILYVWRGEALFESDGRQKISLEDTPARFGIVKIEKDDQLLALRREHGIVRIISEQLEGATEEEKYLCAYKIWLKKLVGGGAFFPLRLMDWSNNKEGKTVLTLALETTESGLEFYAEQPNAMGKASELDNRFSSFLKIMGKSAAPHLLPLEHTVDANTSKIRYRSHGIYKTYFDVFKICIFRYFKHIFMARSSFTWIKNKYIPIWFILFVLIYLINQLLNKASKIDFFTNLVLSKAIPMVYSFGKSFLICSNRL
jgi:hypothetical protein